MDGGRRAVVHGDGDAMPPAGPFAGAYAARAASDTAAEARRWADLLWPKGCSCLRLVVMHRKASSCRGCCGRRPRSSRPCSRRRSPCVASSPSLGTAPCVFCKFFARALCCACCHLTHGGMLFDACWLARCRLIRGGAPLRLGASFYSNLEFDLKFFAVYRCLPAAHCASPFKWPRCSCARRALACGAFASTSAAWLSAAWLLSSRPAACVPPCLSRRGHAARLRAWRARVETSESLL